MTIDERLERIEGLLSQLLQRLDSDRGIDHPSTAILHKLTTRQHVAMQMVVAGLSNADIAQVMGVTENTAKVHVRVLARKLGVNTRAQITAKVLPLMQVISDNEYLDASGGLPRHWVHEWRTEKGRRKLMELMENDGEQE